MSCSSCEPHSSHQVAVIIGEIAGRYLNDWLLELAVRKSKGIFEAEYRLWSVSSHCTYHHPIDMVSP